MFFCLEPLGCWSMALVQWLYFYFFCNGYFSLFPKKSKFFSPPCLCLFGHLCKFYFFVFPLSLPLLLLKGLNKFFSLFPSSLFLWLFRGLNKCFSFPSLLRLCGQLGVQWWFFVWSFLPCVLSLFSYLYIIFISISFSKIICDN